MAQALGAPIVVVDEKSEAADAIGGDAWKTILFNCDCHTFDEVERVVIKATGCTLSRARQISFEVHSHGSATVYEGPRERCETVAGILASIGLRVRATP